jgi:hypothetical protein
MLSSLHKKCLSKVIQEARVRFSQEALVAEGPARIVEAVIQSCKAGERVFPPERQVPADNLLENRQEAEQYIAGLLGLM